MVAFNSYVISLSSIKPPDQPVDERSPIAPCLSFRKMGGSWSLGDFRTVFASIISTIDFQGRAKR